jgi:hypothetical protein
MQDYTRKTLFGKRLPAIFTPISVILLFFVTLHQRKFFLIEANSLP